jgi:hypothetical protein
VTGIRTTPCACIYFDLAEEQNPDGPPVCECGHVDDEHNDDLECMAEVEL